MPRLRLFPFLLLSFGLLVDASCSGDSSPALPSGPVAGASTWELISPDGGTFTTVDDVTLTVPAGAVTAPTFIGVTRWAPSPLAPFSTTVTGSSGWPDSYAIDPIGPEYQIDPAGTTFMVPISITIPVPAGSSSAVLVANETIAWPGLPSTMVDATHIAGQMTKASLVFPATVTQVEQGCATAADCASGQSCPVHTCTAN